VRDAVRVATRPSDPADQFARRLPAARTQVAIAIAFGAVVGIVMSLVTTWQFGTLLGWDAAAGAYVTFVWAATWPRDAAETARLAAREDPTRGATDLLLLTAAVASLAAVGNVLVSASRASGGAQELRIALGLASVVVSWVLVHTVYMLQYARLYYSRPEGGVDFNDEKPPTYRDFAYLAFTIGMTFQVSDTTLQSHEFRAAALRQALLAFVFSTGILATTINLVASLSTR
jgi:uncharacterized membrane protein